MSYEFIPGPFSYLHLADTKKRFEAHDSTSLFLVDHASSKQFARSYFGGDGVVFESQEFKTLKIWQEHLGSEHWELIQDKVALQGIQTPRGGLKWARELDGVFIR